MRARLVSVMFSCHSVLPDKIGIGIGIGIVVGIGFGSFLDRGTACI